MTDQWVPPAPTTPPPPITPPPLPPANSWTDIAGCTVGPNQPSIVNGIVISGVPATISSVYWQVSLNDGSGNFQINQLDGAGNLVGTSMQGSRVDGSMSVAQDPTQPLGVVTKEYADALPPGEAPLDGQSYVRTSAAWTVQPRIIPEAPGTSQIFGRMNSVWAVVPIQADAPSDGNTYGRSNGAWNQALATTGGTITGSLTVNQVLTVQGSNSFVLNGPIGNQRSILGMTSTIARWGLTLGDGTTEGLNNVGSNFTLAAYSTTGAFLGNWLTIARADGSTTFNGSGVTINGGLAVNGLLALASPNNLAIYGGSAGQFLSTNGAGILSWQTPPGAGGGIGEAPNDGTAYARKSAAWAHLAHTDITDWAATLANYYPTSNPSGYQTAAQVTAALAPYALTSSLANYLPLTGGTVTGALTVDGQFTTNSRFNAGGSNPTISWTANGAGGNPVNQNNWDIFEDDSGNLYWRSVNDAYTDSGYVLEMVRGTGYLSPSLNVMAPGGTSFAAGINFGSTFASSPTDLTHHIALFGGGPSAWGGFSITSGALNIVASSAVAMSFGTASAVMGPGVALTLAQDPTVPLGAATKQYVDAHAGGGGDTNDIAYFGDGSDGAVSITTAVTLTRDMYYSNLTISGAGVLNTAGWRVFVSGILDISAAGAGAIVGAALTQATNGANPTAGTGGRTAAGGFTVGNTGGSNGGAGISAAGNGATGQAASSLTGAALFLGGVGGQGGAGGVVGSNTGGNGGGVAAYNAARFRLLTTTVLPVPPPSGGNPLFAPGFAGGGGGSGSNTSTNPSGGGGGGGVAGYMLLLFARTINRGAATAVGALNAAGGNGGNGGPTAAGAAGGGGGGGGGGGFVYLVFRFLTGAVATNAVNASGGNGGNGQGTGIGGTGGAAGTVLLFNLAADTVAATTGPAGSGPSGATGGAGGACLVTL